MRTRAELCTCNQLACQLVSGSSLSWHASRGSSMLPVAVVRVTVSVSVSVTVTVSVTVVTRSDQERGFIYKANCALFD